jgi:hypothetical protein
VTRSRTTVETTGAQPSSLMDGMEIVDREARHGTKVAERASPITTKRGCNNFDSPVPIEQRRDSSKNDGRKAWTHRGVRFESEESSDLETDGLEKPSKLSVE